jgi:hypothetical protein
MSGNVSLDQVVMRLVSLERVVSSLIAVTPGPPPKAAASPRSRHTAVRGGDAIDVDEGQPRPVPEIGLTSVWSSVDMRIALASRDFRRVFLLLQRSGVSQRKIARACGCAQSEVSEIIGGRRVADYGVLVRYCQGLGIPRGWVGLAFDPETATIVDHADPG